MILGAGPNRIGQGIEFDYCCVHAAMTVRAADRDAVMVNCNPETVSTDYDTSDRLYFEPLTLEDVLGVVEAEQPEGVIVQFGGQTPLKLAHGLEQAGVTILGTSVDAIDLAEDRGRFGALLESLGYAAPPYATATSVDEAIERAPAVGWPLLVRPSYVLGGRAMEIVYDADGLRDYLSRHARDNREIFLDRFLENAIEVDVDALCDGEDVWIGGIMQHVEEAGIHSGDSACVLPPHSLGPDMLDTIREQTRGIALGLGVVGLINIQYAIHAGSLYVIEANPRASRTVPFVSKAIGIPLAKMACRLMLGEKLGDLALPADPLGCGHVSVKEAVLPFDRFEGADAILGPEMRSTGEVMGVARDFPTAFAKAQAAAGSPLPQQGTVFITVTDSDKSGVHGIAGPLYDAGFRIVATAGTAQAVRSMGVPCESINKLAEGSPHVVDLIESGDVTLVVNTPDGLRRAHRRLRDPPRRDRARDPVPDDAVGRRRRGPRDRRRRARPGRGAVAAGAAPGDGSGLMFGRRACTVVGSRDLRALRRHRGPRSRRARAGAGPVLHAGRRRALGRRRGRAPVPAARLQRAARPRRAAVVPVRRRRPGNPPADGARPRGRALDHRAAGGGLAPDRPAPGPRSAAASGSPRWRRWPTPSTRPRSCSASATRTTPRRGSPLDD